MMNKQQITQEEFDKKVKCLIEDQEDPLKEYLLKTNKEAKSRLTEFIKSNLKERYEIK